MRVMHASARPKRRAAERRSCGRRLTAIEMKTRLSTPSTISSVVSVSNAIQISVLNIHSTAIDPARSRYEPRREDHRPADDDVDHQQEHRGRAHVLGAPDELVETGAD